MEKMLNSMVEGVEGAGGEEVGALAQPTNTAAMLKLKKRNELHLKSAGSWWVCKGLLQIGDALLGEGRRIIPLVTRIQQLSSNFPDLMVNFVGILTFFTFFYFQ